MRTIVCGHRKMQDQELINTTLDKANITFLINGGAKGADTLAFIWAVRNKVPYQTFMANWNGFGRAAGPIRNKQMINEGKPDNVIAFLAKDSKGTANMIMQAQQANIPVTVINI